MANITSPLLNSMVLLHEENRELRNVIAKKDIEIEQYKYDGAILTRSK